MITYLLNTLVDSIKTSLINKLGLDPSTEVDLDDFPQLIDDIPILDSVEELTVTQNGTYTGTDGVTYNPVNVNLPLGSKSVTANGTYSASDDSLQGYSSVTVDIDDTDLYRDTTDSTYESVKTLSNCGAFPMLSLTAEINAVQDLHGYDKPWAGGAGVNKCPEEWVAFGTTGIRSANNFDVQPETEYYFYSPVNAQIYFRDADGNNISGITNPQVIGSNTTFTTPSGCYKILLALQKYGTTYNNDIAINYPSSITTYSPYSNICPISGHTEVNTQRTGKNLFDANTAVQGYYISDGTGAMMPGNASYASDYIKVDAGQTYRISPVLSSGNWGAWYDENKTFISGFIGYSTTNTAPSNAKYLRFTVSHSGSNPNYATTTQVELGSTATTYEPYNGTTYTIDLDGTRYGGTLDVVSGELKVVPYYASYNGETLEGEWISDRDVYAVGTTPTIGAQVVNIGATPTTYQLTPTQVKSLLGTNNVWADTGDVGDVRYFKKVEL